ncbi:MAG: hypothetical protein DRJ66_02050 [Thermoprotei archaeon]|nr:MAG: hypothetical protein DRJ66_02050 [Thermoprotei archaeon]
MNEIRRIVPTILVLVLLLAIINTCNLTKAQELTYEITDTEIVVTGATFEIHISKGGGINAYYFMGYPVLGTLGEGVAINIWDRDWSAHPTTRAEVIKDPEVKMYDWGLMIKTYSRVENPNKNLFYKYTTVHKIYKSGAVVISTVVEAYKDSDFAGGAILITFPCQFYKSGKVFAYRQGDISFKVEELPPEYNPEAEQEGFVISSGTLDSGYLVMPPEGKINVIIVYVDPPEIKYLEVSDARAWGSDYFYLCSWVAPDWTGLNLIPISAGDSHNFTWIVFPHNNGPSFSERFIKILNEGKRANDYILKVEKIAKSAKAKEDLKKAKEMLSKLLDAICSGDLDKAEGYATNAYKYARSAYSTEATRAGIRYIVIPIVICVALYGIAAKKWKGGEPEEIEEGK